MIAAWAPCSYVKKANYIKKILRKENLMKQFTEGMSERGSGRRKRRIHLSDEIRKNIYAGN